jgi:diguanylate cyclase
MPDRSDDLAPAAPLPPPPGGRARVGLLGLGAKFTLSVLTILAVTLVANTLYSLHASSRFHEQQLVERGNALGRLISLVSPEAILGFDFLQLNEYTRQVSSQRDVVYGVILSPQGVPLSAYLEAADPWIKDRLDRATTTELPKVLQALDRDAELIRLEFPILHNDALLGRFVVGLSKQSLHAEFRRQLLVQSLALTLIVLFLGTAIHMVFRYNVLFPIRDLINASSQVGRNQYTPVPVKASDELGLLAQAFNSMADEVRHEQAKLHRQAHFDTLTGLPNRLMALDRINQAINRAKRSPQRFALFFIDLDNFKSVNDSLGHALGDELLIATGARLQAILRDADTVARLGGDEFLVLTPDVGDEVQAEEVAERLITAISRPLDLNGRSIVARCSIGIALFPENGSAVETLMANADNAMYQAKANAQGSAIFFTEEMNTRLHARMQMEQDLNLALERGELRLHFQPIFDGAGLHHQGAEVLLRWYHPERGEIPPGVFVPLAELSGQIVRIGDWVLEQACRDWAAWSSAGIDPGFLAINVSRVQLGKRFASRLAELLTRYGVPPQAIELEVTESVLLDDHEQVAEELSSLRAVGVTLSLDDFGTGYSSLSYLKRFRFDVLKIDRSFVAGLPDSAEDVLLVKAILAMAKGLDLRVVAEGVETQDQLTFLSGQGCDLSQGYFLSRPLTDTAYSSYLQRRRPGVEALRLTGGRDVRRIGTSS